MMKGRIKLLTEKIRKEKKITKKLAFVLLLLLLLLFISYVLVSIFYNKGNFTITLDQNLYYNRGLIIYSNPDLKKYKSELVAAEPTRFTNINGNWIPKDIHETGVGSHNGDNYLAYTFFVENTGTEDAHYWSELVLPKATYGIDEAVRIKLYRNDREVTYAKKNIYGNPEPNTVPFMDDKIIAREYIENFKPGSLDKYTLVIWVEGTDRECNDSILNGEFQVYMKFNSTYIEKEK